VGVAVDVRMGASSVQGAQAIPKRTRAIGMTVVRDVFIGDSLLREALILPFSA
jgi:hypothetical protein